MSNAKLLGLLFAIATALFWGLYGPALGKARPVTDPNPSPFKPFIFIGLAYLVWGVVGGFAGVKATGGSFTFRPEAISWGFIAGSLGAFGALTLTYAMFEAKDARLVMPVVFGGATAVSAIAATILSRQHHVPPAQMVGFALVIVGVILIQMFGSHPAPAKPAKPASTIPSAASPDHSETPAT
jgi:drug/metabolite transporter (DMT)-like permease